MLIGEIDSNKPRKLVKDEVRKDTKRYIRVDDIQGAQPRDNMLIPENKLLELHPLFQENEKLNSEMKDLRKNYRNRMRNSD